MRVFVWCGRLRLGVLGVLACLIFAASVGMAHAQAIGAGSCQTTDGSTACASDPDLASVGYSSCDGINAPCSYDAALTSVGDDACSEVGESDCSDDAVLTNVGDASCNGAEACADAPYLTSVGYGSCNAVPFPCSSLSAVGDNSCDGDYDVCTGAGSESVGSGSCDGREVCVDGAASGNDSCDGFGDCNDGGTSGSGSCNGFGACVGGATSGNYSCNGDDACYEEMVSGDCESNTDSVPQCVPASDPSLEAGSAPPGWNASAVTVDWNWSSGPDGAPLAPASASNCPVSSTSSGEGAMTLTATCADENGNVGSGSYTVNVDTTAPTIGFSGDASPYSLLATVDITCSATDAISGIATSTCPGANGPAWTFGAGTTTLTATATNNAGLVANASTQFVVQVTAGPLCQLTTQFGEDSAKYQALRLWQQDVTEAEWNAACKGFTRLASRLTPKQTPALIHGFDKKVQTLAGAGWLSTSQASTLTGLAAAL